MASPTLGWHRIGPHYRPLVMAILVLCSGTADAQWSGFGSLSGGYQSNPLYNYQHHGDQIYTAYLDLGYSRQPFSARYIGGLTLFNQLTERNYLEHGLTMDLVLKRGGLRQSKEEDETSEESDEVVGRLDSIGTYALLGARLTARHDKKVYKEYDNRSAFLTGSYYRGYQDPWHIRVVGEAGYRSYPSLKELSNITALLTTQLGVGKNSGTSGGGWLLGGYRYYTSATYDTTLYVTRSGGQNGKKTGSGKGGAVLTGPPTTTKQVLSNADERFVTQIAVGLFLSQAWTEGSAEISGLYRANLAGSARVIARTSENASINEDIYNDFFAYEGPEASVSLSQAFPLNVRAMLAFRFASKRFGSPAFDLEANQTAESREDQQFGADVTISRYFPVSDAFGIDLALSGYAVRNASNDQYNDFHGWGLSFSIGAGF